MDDIMAAIIGAVIVAVVGAIVLGVQQWLKRRVKMTGAGAEVEQLRPLVVMLLTVQKPQLEALLAVLGALREKMNGEFEPAREGVERALKLFDETLLKGAIKGVGE